MVSFSKLFVHGVCWSLGVLIEPGLGCTISIRACVILLARFVSTQVRMASSSHSVTCALAIKHSVSVSTQVQARSCYLKGVHLIDVPGDLGAKYKASVPQWQFPEGTNRISV